MRIADDCGDFTRFRELLEMAEILNDDLPGRAAGKRSSGNDGAVRSKRLTMIWLGVLELGTVLIYVKSCLRVHLASIHQMDADLDPYNQSPPSWRMTKKIAQGISGSATHRLHGCQVFLGTVAKAKVYWRTRRQ